MSALLFKRPDDPFDHTILLWAMRRDELLPKAVAGHQRGVAAAGKNEPVVRPKQERLWHTAQRTEAGDQSVLQSAAGGCRLAAARQMPAEQFTRMAIDHQRQRCPAITSRPDAAQIRIMSPAILT